MNTFTATEVKQGLSAVLNSALRAPVRITRQGADSYDFVLLSAAEYQRLAALDEAVAATAEAEGLGADDGAGDLGAGDAEWSDEEDAYWSKMAREARAEGTLGPEESAKIVQELMAKLRRLEEQGLA